MGRSDSIENMLASEFIEFLDNKSYRSVNVGTEGNCFESNLSRGYAVRIKFDSSHYTAEIYFSEGEDKEDEEPPIDTLYGTIKAKRKLTRDKRWKEIFGRVEKIMRNHHAENKST